MASENPKDKLQAGAEQTQASPLPSEPAELVQWIWINRAAKEISLQPKEGFHMMVFRSAGIKRNYLIFAEKNGFTGV